MGSECSPSNLVVLVQPLKMVCRSGLKLFRIWLGCTESNQKEPDVTTISSCSCQRLPKSLICSIFLKLEAQIQRNILYPRLCYCVDKETRLQRICYSHWANGAWNGVISIGQWGVFNHEKGAIWQSHLAAQKEGVVTAIIFSNHKTS